ncbi:hypothetical protein ES703_36115 [subsurface metagenome]
MAFIPKLKQWYYEDCYNDMGVFYYQQKEARAKSLVHDDFNEEFFKTFL